MNSDLCDSATILVVEHDPALGAALVEQLAADGYPARLARTVPQASALLLRAGHDGSSCTLVRAGPLTIDTAARAAHLHGRRLPLRRLEYDLLLALARDPRRVFAKRELMRLVWGTPAPAATRTLDSHASRLRRKLAVAAAADQSATAYPARWIVCVRGVGYRLR
jgi:DNA-binding response OmpR family regulator